jgi:hypothetical protein
MNQNRTASKIGARSTLISRGLILASIALSFSAHATLGGDGASVTADQTALHATVKITPEANYTDYALTQPDGVVVHEFVNTASHVFEVTWRGLGHRPDMEQILGQYAERFHGQSKVSRPMNRHADRVESDLEIHSAVRNRYFTGTAHIPGLLPESLSTAVRVPVEVKQ